MIKPSCSDAPKCPGAREIAYYFSTRSGRRPYDFHRQVSASVVGHIEAPKGRSFRRALALGKTELGVVVLDQAVTLGRSISADDAGDAELARMAHQFLQDGLLDPAPKDAAAHEPCVDQPIIRVAPAD